MNEAQQVYEALVEIQRMGQVAALATVIRTQGSVPRHAGTKMVIYRDGQIVGTVGGGAMESRVVEAAQNIMQTGEPATVSYSLTDLGAGDPGICGGTAEIFIEPIGVTPTLVVIGCGHVGQALVTLGKWSGFRVVASDDRADYCNPQHVPEADECLAVPPAELLDHLEVTPLTYVAAVTRGLPIDEELFPKLLQSPAPYIGLIGSKRRWALTRKALIEQHGIAADVVDRVHSPIGYEIGAETPEEIAISIMAQIIALYRG